MPSSALLRSTIFTWMALLSLTLLSAATTLHGHQPAWRLGAALVVAVICGVKARLLVRGFLRSQDAGPTFDRIICLFASLVPLLLAVTALWSALVSSRS